VANIFKAKTLVSRTGIFSHEVIAPNLVYNTGDQTISGIKTFATGVNINGNVGIGIDNNNFDLYVRKSRAGVSVNPDSDSIAVFELCAIDTASINLFRCIWNRHIGLICR
jgi:hypothetical protein